MGLKTGQGHSTHSNPRNDKGLFAVQNPQIPSCCEKEEKNKKKTDEIRKTHQSFWVKRNGEFFVFSQGQVQGQRDLRRFPQFAKIY